MSDVEREVGKKWPEWDRKGKKMTVAKPEKLYKSEELQFL